MKSKMPKVSVIMPVFNGEAYIEGAINSVLEQSLDDFELIIVNDGSSDHTLDLVNAFADKRIKLINRSENSGLAVTRNEGVAAASGQYVAMLDSDDTATPDRLEIQSGFLDHNRDIGVVGSWVNVLDEKGHFTGEVWQLETCAEKMPAALLFHNCLAQSAVMIRRELLDSAPYRLDFPPAEDYDLWVRLAKTTRLVNIPRALVNYRCHPAGVSRRKAEVAEACTKTVILAQLEDIGLLPGAGELRVHRRLGTGQGADADVTFGMAEQWLERLLIANKQANKYNLDAFREVIHERWFAFCQASSSVGWMAFRTYRKSFLGKIARLPLRHLYGFGLRCALKK